MFSKQKYRHQQANHTLCDDGSNELISLFFNPETPQAKKQAALRILKGEEDKPAIETDKFMSVKETCQYLAGISRVHLYFLRKKGLPSHNIGGRLGFKGLEVTQWLATQK